MLFLLTVLTGLGWICVYMCWHLSISMWIKAHFIMIIIMFHLFKILKYYKGGVPYHIIPSKCKAITGIQLILPRTISWQYTVMTFYRSTYKIILEKWRNNALVRNGTSMVRIGLTPVHVLFIISYRIFSIFRVSQNLRKCMGKICVCSHS